MNKFTKIVAGIGLATATLGAFAMPANAATEPTTHAAASTAAAQGDRVTGIVNFLYEPFPGDAPRFSMARHPNPTHPTYTDLVQVADSTSSLPHAAWELPAAGTHGPIKLAGTNDCITDRPGENGAKWAACDGSAAQEFTVVLRSDGYYEAQRTDNSKSVLNNGGAVNNNAAIVRFYAPGAAFMISNYSSLTPVPGHTVVPVDITGPVDGEVSDTRNPTITGTGDEGAEVILTDDAGTELCRATVSSGAWSCTVGVNLPDGPIKITATQTATDGTTTTDNVSIIIADPLNSPVIDPTLAGGAGIALFAIAGTVIAIRNRKNKATI
ncbi:hypothetical protein [Microbacterium oxydans]|uniref:hypothetical protein n=1 Tax=Microbacterium oxydans TaxID=82380 RepID=UPI00226B2B1C|nr:hypothetical protein [Microbacterium oxydans]WAA65609.1 hypothetical protein MME74_15455 [Microbacterium oxydans]